VRPPGAVSPTEESQFRGLKFRS